jgi:hypothetical protein
MWAYYARACVLFLRALSSICINQYLSDTSYEFLYFLDLYFEFWSLQNEFFSIFKNNGICHKNYPKLAFDSSTIEKKCHINISIGAWEQKFSRALERHLSRCRAAPLRGRYRVDKKSSWDWMSNNPVTYVTMRQKLESSRKNTVRPEGEIGRSGKSCSS